MNSANIQAILTSRSGNNIYFSEYFDESGSLEKKHDIDNFFTVTSYQGAGILQCTTVVIQ